MSRAKSAKVALFARAPVIGQVKQRLAQEIGAAKALLCYRALLQTALEATRQYATTIWYEGSADVWDQIAPDRRLKEQPPGDLGHKMFTTLNEGAKLVVGADIPLLSGAYIDSALDYLTNKKDLVIGPTEDGGYCLIGMNEPHEYLFENISWGSNRVLEQTLSRAQELGLRVVLLPKLWDVDTGTDYLRWKKEIPQDETLRTFKS